jgi:hypothetical protein
VLTRHVAGGVEHGARDRDDQLGTAAEPRPNPPHPVPEIRIHPMRTAIATVCLSGTLAEKVEAIAAARFKGVEIFENDLLSFNGTPATPGA